MKFDDLANSILGEDWHDRWAERHEGPGLGNLRGMSDVQDPAEIQWREAGRRAAELKRKEAERKEAELDKKEAYKSNLLRKDEEPINDDFIDMVKSMPTDQLKGLFREDLHAYYELIEGSASEDRAQDRIAMIGNELLKRGLTSEELASIRDEAKQAANK